MVVIVMIFHLPAVTRLYLCDVGDGSKVIVFHTSYVVVVVVMLDS